MTDYAEQAKANFRAGYNCAQSVLLTFAKELGLDDETALRISSGFGGGMGRMREVCGAVSGMFMALGIKEGCVSPSDKQSKTQTYSAVRELAARFSEENGSIICRELLGLDKKSDSPVPEDRTKKYYQKRPCEELVGDAARIFAEYLNDK